MNIEHLKENGTDIAVISSDEKLIVDTQSALDLAMTVKYETGVANIVISKSAVCEEFFILSSGMAGEILQKYINYHVRIAIYGDYTQYTSKPLKDFIYESNKGKDFFCVNQRRSSAKADRNTITILYRFQLHIYNHHFNSDSGKPIMDLPLFLCAGVRKERGSFSACTPRDE